VDLVLDYLTNGDTHNPAKAAAGDTHGTTQSRKGLQHQRTQKKNGIDKPYKQETSSQSRMKFQHVRNDKSPAEQLDMEESRLVAFAELGYAVDDEYLRGVLDGRDHGVPPSHASKD